MRMGGSPAIWRKDAMQECETLGSPELMWPPKQKRAKKIWERTTMCKHVNVRKRGVHFGRRGNPYSDCERMQGEADLVNRERSTGDADRYRGNYDPKKQTQSDARRRGFVTRPERTRIRKPKASGDSERGGKKRKMLSQVSERNGQQKHGKKRGKKKPTTKRSDARRKRELLLSTNWNAWATAGTFT